MQLERCRLAVKRPKRPRTHWFAAQREPFGPPRRRQAVAQAVAQAVPQVGRVGAGERPVAETDNHCWMGVAQEEDRSQMPGTVQVVER